MFRTDEEEVVYRLLQHLEISLELAGVPYLKTVADVLVVRREGLADYSDLAVGCDQPLGRTSVTSEKNR